MSHTPEPWKAVSLRDYVNVQPEPGGQFQPHPIVNYVLGGPDYVEIVCSTGLNYPRCEANAHAIEALPDLLKACRMALDNLTGLTFGTDTEVQLIEALRAAIAKAEGKP